VRPLHTYPHLSIAAAAGARLEAAAPAAAEVIVGNEVAAFLPSHDPASEHRTPRMRCACFEGAGRVMPKPRRFCKLTPRGVSRSGQLSEVSPSPTARKSAPTPPFRFRLRALHGLLPWRPTTRNYTLRRKPCTKCSERATLTRDRTTGTRIVPAVRIPLALWEQEVVGSNPAAPICLMWRKPKGFRSAYRFTVKRAACTIPCSRSV